LFANKEWRLSSASKRKGNNVALAAQHSSGTSSRKRSFGYSFCVCAQRRPFGAISYGAVVQFANANRHNLLRYNAKIGLILAQFSHSGLSEGKPEGVPTQPIALRRRQRGVRNTTLRFSRRRSPRQRRLVFKGRHSGVGRVTPLYYKGE